MNASLQNTVYLAGAFLALFGTAELFYHKFKISAELTRKYVHTATGLLTMLFPPLIQNRLLVLVLCSSFLIIVLLSRHYRLLPSIHAVKRKTTGSIHYPIIVSGCYLVYMEYGQLIFYYLPILIMAICDPVASIVGRKWPRGHYKVFGGVKTLSGSLGFFASALLLSMALVLTVERLQLSEAILLALTISAITTVIEGITHRGYDNLLIPAGSLAVLILFIN